MVNRVQGTIEEAFGKGFGEKSIAQGTIERPFGKWSTEKSIAQGTIEYLVVLALVVVGLVIGIFDSPSQQISSSSNQLGLSSQVIGITESMIDPVEDGNFVVSLLNNSGDIITVSNVKVGDNNSDYSEDLAQGDGKYFVISSGDNCSAGGVVSEDVVITYVTRDGLTKTEKYPAKVMFDCTPYTIAANMLADQCPATCSGGAQSLSADSVTVAAGCYTATTLTTVDSDLAAGNILSGVTIFGIAGTAEEGPDLIWSGVLSSSYDWAGAIGACSSLGAGYSWRLPTIDELESFMSSCNSDPDCLWIYSYNLWSSTEDESYYDEFNLVYPYAYALTGEFGRQSWEKYNTSNVVCVRDA